MSKPACSAMPPAAKTYGESAYINFTLRPQINLGLASFRKVIGSGPVEPQSIAVGQPGAYVDMMQYPSRLPTLKEAADLLVAEAMGRTGNNQTRAAKLLGISRPALSKRLKKSS